MNPASSTESQAAGVFDGWQAGYAKFNGSKHAGIWNGTAASWIDLHDLLPGNLYSYSEATGVYAVDGSIWVSGQAFDSASSKSMAMLWQYTPVPEPSSILALLVGLCGIGRLVVRWKK